MVWEDTMETELSRYRFNFREEFDVVLACPYSRRPPKTIRKKMFPLYESIGEVVKTLGKHPYIPHKEIHSSWDIEKRNTVMKNVLLSADIVIGYADIYHPEVDELIRTAEHNNIPLILQKRLYDVIHPVSSVFEVVDCNSNEELFSKLEASLRKFYESKQI